MERPAAPTCMPLYMRTLTHAHSHMYTHAHTQKHKHTHKYTHTHTHSHSRTHKLTRILSLSLTHTHTHARTHTHPRTNSLFLSFPSLSFLPSHTRTHTHSLARVRNLSFALALTQGNGAPRVPGFVRVHHMCAQVCYFVTKFFFFSLAVCCSRSRRRSDLKCLNLQIMWVSHDHIIRGPRMTPVKTCLKILGNPLTTCLKVMQNSRVYLLEFRQSYFFTLQHTATHSVLYDTPAQRRDMQMWI